VSEVNSNSSIVSENHKADRYWWGLCGLDSARNWTWIYQDNMMERTCPYFAHVMRFSGDRWWGDFSGLRKHHSGSNQDIYCLF
jgi:hypothetical protein